MKQSQDRKVIIILGPTGVGKTAFSIRLARVLDTEIISADSMLVYRHMDIGTAKPSREELEAVPHHLVNILNPDEKFSAGLFREKALEIISRLHDENRIPLIVGGTGFYIRTLTGGLFKGPSADEVLRKQLIDEEMRFGKGHLYNRLKRVDPEAAGGIDPNDQRRIIRALEVYVKEERKISEVQRETTTATDFDFIKIGLIRDRRELHRIIEERVDRMMRDGLLEETRRLLKMKPDSTAMQALGYKEMKLYLDGETDLSDAVRLTKKRTKMFAKRQHTWFNKERGISWVDITGLVDEDSIYKKVIQQVEILGEIIYS